MDITARDWNIVVTLGIKCNIAPILSRIGKRYTSSPFDNMDSVEGLVQAGELLASKFQGYFEDRSRWCIRNDYPRNTSEIRAKIVWHENYPSLYFPHFHPGWFDAETAPRIAEWIKDPKGSLDLVWEGLKATYSRRQNRLIDLLSSGNRVLFLRAEERSQLRRLEKRNLVEDLQIFSSAVSGAFPSCDYGILYFACEQETFPEVASDAPDSERTRIVRIPSTVPETEFIEESLNKLHILPLSLMESQSTLSASAQCSPSQES